MEDHLQRQPVGELPDEQAEQRHDDRQLEQDPDRHLHDPDHTAEVQPGSGDELELLAPRLLSLRSNTSSTSALMLSSTVLTIRGASACTRLMTSRCTRFGSDSHNPGWYFAATSRTITSAGRMSCFVMVSQAMLAIRTARFGTMPANRRTV
jgi:hypothetical protein